MLNGISKQKRMLEGINLAPKIANQTLTHESTKSRAYDAHRNRRLAMHWQRNQMNTVIAKYLDKIKIFRCVTELCEENEDKFVMLRVKPLNLIHKLIKLRKTIDKAQNLFELYSAELAMLDIQCFYLPESVELRETLLRKISENKALFDETEVKFDNACKKIDEDPQLTIELTGDKLDSLLNTRAKVIVDSVDKLRADWTNEKHPEWFVEQQELSSDQSNSNFSSLFFSCNQFAQQYQDFFLHAHMCRKRDINWLYDDISIKMQELFAMNKITCGLNENHEDNNKYYQPTEAMVNLIVEAVILHRKADKAVKLFEKYSFDLTINYLIHFNTPYFKQACGQAIEKINTYRELFCEIKRIFDQIFLTIKSFSACRNKVDEKLARQTSILYISESKKKVMPVDTLRIPMQRESSWVLVDPNSPKLNAPINTRFNLF